MYSQTEFLNTGVYTHNELLELVSANVAIRKSIRNNESATTLASALSSYTSVLGYFVSGVAATAANVASLIFAACASLSALDRSAIVDSMENGTEQLNDIAREMTTNTVRVTIGWLKFQETASSKAVQVVEGAACT